MKISEWTGCYDGSWKGVIQEDAFSHPAKFARTLIGRIYRHLLDSCYVRPGDRVVDPFGGVALGAIDAMVNGLHWIGCELEPKFHKLGNANIDRWNRQFGPSAGWGSAVLLQGDSRNLAAVVGPALADVVCSSPPYAASAVTTDGGYDDAKLAAAKESGVTAQRATWGTNKGSSGQAGYGQTPGNLGNLPPGQVDSVVSSPPYAECLRGDGTAKETAAESHAKRSDPKQGGSLGQSQRHQGYGGPENLGNLPAGSVADACVTSPPYISGGHHPDQTGAWNTNGRGQGQGKDVAGYGTQLGQLGQEPEPTFWSSAKIIVQQCYAILKPGGVAVWVCKDFVRAKKRVPFSDDWRRLCESLGFVTVEWIKASLVKEWEEATLFNGTEKRRRERKSFFRRLAEKKGSPRIDHEDVLLMRKP